MPTTSLIQAGTLLSAAKYKAASFKPRRDSLMLFLGIKSYTNLLISKYQLLAASLYLVGIFFNVIGAKIPTFCIYKVSILAPH